MLKKEKFAEERMQQWPNYFTGTLKKKCKFCFLSVFSNFHFFNYWYKFEKQIYLRENAAMTNLFCGKFKKKIAFFLCWPFLQSRILIFIITDVFPKKKNMFKRKWGIGQTILLELWKNTNFFMLISNFHFFFNYWYKHEK